MVESLVFDILLFFAVFRFTRLLVGEHGIFGIFSLIRSLAGVYETTVQRPNALGQMIDIKVNDANNPIGQILTCFYCCSVWVAIPAAIVATIVSPDSLPLYVWFAIHWFAISGGAILIKDIT